MALRKTIFIAKEIFKEAAESDGRGGKIDFKPVYGFTKISERFIDFAHGSTLGSKSDSLDVETSCFGKFCKKFCEFFLFGKSCRENFGKPGFGNSGRRSILLLKILSQKNRDRHTIIEHAIRENSIRKKSEHIILKRALRPKAGSLS